MTTAQRTELEIEWSILQSKWHREDKIRNLSALAALLLAIIFSTYLLIFMV
jgi:hypothetical protein